MKNSNIKWYSLAIDGSCIDFDVPNLPGVYIYKYLQDTDKIYVGSSMSLRKRIIVHRSDVKNGKDSCPLFYNAVRKYGWNQFEFGILDYIDNKTSPTILLAREQYYLSLLQPYYNVNKIASSSFGLKRSQETLTKMSMAQLGKKHSLETRAKISKARREQMLNPLYEETRAILRQSRLGKSLSAESRRKISEAKLGKKRGPYKKKTS
uniref:Putative GIY-YIG homing endonuclease n=1 Tax=Coleochaete scutata TaxID=3125 RepID=A0A5P9NWJ7_COLSC|nr:putative GIY-YIG homing endonuclease [Coleochaete scutata]QFU80104.1 putative GIY-YIG homing endonuclease [Coleochaete scutata]